MVFHIFSCIFQYLSTFVGYASLAKLTLIHRAIVGQKKYTPAKMALHVAMRFYAK